MRAKKRKISGIAVPRFETITKKFRFFVDILLNTESRFEIF
jgi:hypothetical protein